jgi:lipopolysaccharide heptosyltransferase I
MSSQPTIKDRSPRILIVRLSAIGDVIHGMPLACTLRERFPAAFLAWAVEERAAMLLRGHETLDELITLPRGWLKSPGTVWRLARRLSAMNFDTAIDVQGLTKAAIVAWLSGAKRRIGFGNPWGRELSQWFNTELVDTTAEHAVDRTLQLLLPLGIVSPEVRFQIPEHPADRAAAEQMIRRAGLGCGFAMLNPGAGWPSKLWPTQRYAAVAEHLGRSWKLPSLVVWGTENERAMAERIVSQTSAHARAAPSMALTQLAALARRCRLFVGPDTGPLHLAAAVGASCVGLYGPWPAARHGPYGPRHIALQERFFEGSTRARRNAPPEFMEAIGVELVCEACDRILERDGRHAA